jgi:REP element-mobilizing transposase RayT
VVGFCALWELFPAGGPATKVNTQRSLAGRPHDRAARLRTKEALTYPAVVFNGRQAQSIANGFAAMTAKADYRVYACSILPEHVHMVLGRYRYKVETMVRLLKAEATSQLTRDGLHALVCWPLEDGSLPSPWAHGRWKVFLDNDETIRRAIRYVEDNPLKECKPRQYWKFVSRFTGTV